jgi:hypothetical protein
VGFSINLGRREPLSDRRRMIEETNAFLNWALSDDRAAALPRIPARPVEAGGFADLMRRPFGRLVASHWWARALERVQG